MDDVKVTITRRHRELAVEALNLKFWMKNDNDVYRYYKERWLEEGYTAFSGIPFQGELDSVARALANIEHEALQKKS